MTIVVRSPQQNLKRLELRSSSFSLTSGRYNFTHLALRFLIGECHSGETGPVVEETRLDIGCIEKLKSNCRTTNNRITRVSKSNIYERFEVSNTGNI